MNANNTSSNTCGQPPHEVSSRQKFLALAQELREVKLPNNRLKVGENPRKFTRETRSFSILLEPLNNDLDPIAEPIWVVSRDLSTHGIGVLSHEPIEHQYVRIELPDGVTYVFGNVRHNTSIGKVSPLFLVGIEFIN